MQAGRDGGGVTGPPGWLVCRDDARVRTGVPMAVAIPMPTMRPRPPADVLPKPAWGVPYADDAPGAREDGLVPSADRPVFHAARRSRVVAGTVGYDNPHFRSQRRYARKWRRASTDNGFLLARLSRWKQYVAPW